MNFPSDDRYVRFTFADAHRVAGLLREFLPDELLVCLDLNRLRRLHDTRIRDTLRESRDDLNLECHLRPSRHTFELKIESKQSSERYVQ